jgi:tRNA(His) 5'-end guanylyltransferase
MNAAAKAVMTELPDIVIAYGISDEYRYFIFFKFEVQESDQLEFRIPQISCAV